MKFLVTGSEGMIGSRVVQDLLASDHEVIGVDIVPTREQAYEFFELDICSLAREVTFLDAVADIDYVIHLAARTDLEGRNIDDYLVNTHGSRELYEVCNTIKSLKMVIAVSTQLVLPIGSKQKDIVLIEGNDTNLYGKSKVLMEEITRKKLKSKYCIVRPTTVWGAGCNAHYKRFLRILKRGLYFHPAYSNVPKSYGYVGNASYQLIQLCLNADLYNSGKVLYLCDYKPIYLEQYINDVSIQNGWRKPIRMPGISAQLLAMLGDTINKIGIPFPFNSFRLKNIRTPYVYDTGDLESIVGVIPYSYEEALEEYCQWTRSEF